MLFTERTIALVTGASKGIGAACAIDLGREGAVVVVNYHSDAAGAAGTVAAIRAAGGEAVAIQADIADEKAVQAMFRQVRREFGRLDVLVANAGITRDAVMMAMSLDDFETVVRTNLSGVFLACREGFRLMQLNGGGAIVTMASVTAQGFPAVSNYAASKGAIIAFTKGIATEGAPVGIRANAVSPGLVETPLVKNMPDPVRQAILNNTALSRPAEPREVASVVSFLCSPGASYVTGAELLVDGGASLGLVLQKVDKERAGQGRRRMAGSAKAAGSAGSAGKSLSQNGSTVRRSGGRPAGLPRTPERTEA